MTVKELREQLAQFDENMEILYNEPIIGALVPITWKVNKGMFVQTKEGWWFTEDEFNELKESGEKFDDDILIRKEQAYIEEDIPNYDGGELPLSFDDIFGTPDQD